tara:strand:- start:370 stop:606 length:237 start_codon:yes stop_codon:yes gene_type:complete
MTRDKYRFSFEVCFDYDQEVDGSQLLDALRASVADILENIEAEGRVEVDSLDLEYIEQSCCVEYVRAESTYTSKEESV